MTKKHTSSTKPNTPEKEKPVPIINVINQQVNDVSEILNIATSDNYNGKQLYESQMKSISGKVNEKKTKEANENNNDDNSTITVYEKTKTSGERTVKQTKDPDTGKETISDKNTNGTLLISSNVAIPISENDTQIGTKTIDKSYSVIINDKVKPKTTVTSNKTIEVTEIGDKKTTSVTLSNTAKNYISDAQIIIEEGEGYKTTHEEGVVASNTGAVIATHNYISETTDRIDDRDVTIKKTINNSVTTIGPITIDQSSTQQIINGVSGEPQTTITIVTTDKDGKPIINPDTGEPLKRNISADQVKTITEHAEKGEKPVFDASGNVTYVKMTKDELADLEVKKQEAINAAQLDAMNRQLGYKTLTAKEIAAYEGAVSDGENNGDLNIDENTGIYRAKTLDVITNTESDASYSGFREDETITIPNWGINDFINERSEWVKQTHDIAGEPGWWYFKVFFKFNTEYGLLGGILNNSTGNTQGSKPSINTAIAYLKTMNAYNWGKYYADSNLEERIQALTRFVKILSFINCKSPWFFKSVKGLDKANNIYVSGFSEDRQFEISCNPDAIDMRLNTLFDLYKYIAYDNVNCREVLPENLRQFDVSVVLFQAPLKYLHTAMSTKSNGKYDYRKLNSKDNRMSFKLFTFKNCEFVADSVGGGVPSDVANNAPFTIGGNTIKIRYKQVYTHTSNEWHNIIFGSTGVYKEDTDTMQTKRLNAIKTGRTSTYYNPATAQYKELVDMSESLITDAMIGVDISTAYGNSDVIAYDANGYI